MFRQKEKKSIISIILHFFFMDGGYNEGKHLRDFLEFIFFVLGILLLPVIVGFFILIPVLGARNKRLTRYLREYESTPGVGD